MTILIDRLLGCSMALAAVGLFAAVNGCGDVALTLLNKAVGDGYDGCYVEPPVPLACPASGITWVTCGNNACSFRQGVYRCDLPVNGAHLESAGGAGGYHDHCDDAAEGGDGFYQCYQQDIWCYLSRGCLCNAFTGAPQSCHANMTGVSHHVKVENNYVDGEPCLGS